MNRVDGISLRPRRFETESHTHDGSSQTTRPALNYEPKHGRSRFNSFHTISVICWIGPLVAMLAIFVMWLITRNDDLAGPFILTIAGGSIAFLVGLWCVLCGPLPEDFVESTRALRSKAKVFVLLCSNIGVAFLLGWVAIYIVEH